MAFKLVILYDALNNHWTALACQHCTECADYWFCTAQYYIWLCMVLVSQPDLSFDSLHSILLALG